MVGIIGKKLGMTQIFNAQDEMVPVTIVKAGPCPIVQVKKEARDGYDALQLAFEEVSAGKANKPRHGHFAKAAVQAHRLLKEFRTDSGDFHPGQVIDVSQFEVGDRIKVSGRSKGKGFAGVVKRHNFHGKDSTHGTPDRVRHSGSIGQGTTPGKVWKGKKMEGHMGDANVSVRGLSVVRIDPERNLLFIKGAVPGGVNGYLTVCKV